MRPDTQAAMVRMPLRKQHNSAQGKIPFDRAAVGIYGKKMDAVENIKGDNFEVLTTQKIKNCNVATVECVRCHLLRNAVDVH